MEIRGNDPIDGRFYHAPQMQLWRGRDDGKDDAQRRWHQHIQQLNLTEPMTPMVSDTSIVILGFACDEGVKRNQGRTGAADGPAAIRKALCNLPIFYPRLAIYDAGNIQCADGELEAAQRQLAIAVTKI